MIAPAPKHSASNRPASQPSSSFIDPHAVVQPAGGSASVDSVDSIDETLVYMPPLRRESSGEGLLQIAVSQYPALTLVSAGVIGLTIGWFIKRHLR